MLSNSSKYALKALHYLVVHSSPANRVLSTEVASAAEIPKPFLSKILQQLSQKNYVSSIKGPGGGFYLTPEQLEVSLLDVIVAVEGKDVLRQCLFNLEHCDETRPCVVHHTIAAAKQDLRKSLQSIRLDDLRTGIVL